MVSGEASFTGQRTEKNIRNVRNNLITQLENDIRITAVEVPNHQTPAFYNSHF